MTPQARIRRIGWLATISACLVLYVLLHLKVNAVHSEVVRAENEIVRLEERNMLLETEVLTRSNQVKLAQWNRVDFGYRAPVAEQYIDSERRLAQLGGPPADNAPAPIRLATITTGEDAPAFPTLAHEAPAQVAMSAGYVRVAIGPARAAAHQ
jgi:hypothetical protein